MITRGRAGICTRVGDGGIIVCGRRLLLAGSDDERLLACLRISDVMPLGRWRGFRLHSERLFLVTQPHPLGKLTITSTIA
jgi:hypothetical protein